MNIADIVNLFVEVISLVILELLRRNNKATDWIKNRVSKVDEKLLANREINYNHVEELITEVRSLNSKYTDKCDCQEKNEH